MRLRVGLSHEEFAEAVLAGRIIDCVEPAAKQLIAQPNPVGIDDVRLAIIRNLLNPALAKMTVHLTAVDAIRLARKSMILLSSFNVALPWALKDDSTSQRSSASSLYRLKYGRADSPGAATSLIIAR